MRLPAKPKDALPSPIDIDYILLRGRPHTVTGKKDPSFESEKDMCDGLLNTSKCTLEIRHDACETGGWFIFGHECTHDALEWSGLAAVLNANDQEAICDALGSAFITLLVDNPGLQVKILKAFGKDHHGHKKAS